MTVNVSFIVVTTLLFLVSMSGVDIEEGRGVCGCLLVIRGTFKMERQDSSTFECRIPPFSLESKHEDGSTPHGFTV